MELETAVFQGKNFCQHAGLSLPFTFLRIAVGVEAKGCRDEYLGTGSEVLSFKSIHMHTWVTKSAFFGYFFVNVLQPQVVA